MRAPRGFGLGISGEMVNGDHGNNYTAVLTRRVLPCRGSAAVSGRWADEPGG